MWQFGVFIVSVEAGATDFTVEVHHGGFFCGIGPGRCYLNEKVTWFDNLKLETWEFKMIEEMTTLLGYRLLSPNLRVYWLLPGKNLSDGLRIVDCDDDTIVMNQVAHRFNSFVLYFDHHNHVAKNSYKDDIVLNPINTLPKTLSPRKVPRMVGAQLPHFYQNIHRVNSQASGAGNEGDGEGIDDDSED